MAQTEIEDRFGDKLNIETKAELLKFFKNKSPNEQTALKYFYGIPVKEGCFNNTYVSDEEYIALVNEQVGSLESRKARALSKLGLDEEQVREIPPVFFQGWTSIQGDVKGIKNDLYKYTEANRLVTPTRELTWIFFGNEQIFVYRTRIDSCDESLKSERTQEYFYKDITAFASASDSIRAKVSGIVKKKLEFVDRTVENETFKIVVPGESFNCALSPEDDNESKISAMKQKLREKKNN